MLLAESYYLSTFDGLTLIYSALLKAELLPTRRGGGRKRVQIKVEVVRESLNDASYEKIQEVSVPLSLFWGQAVEPGYLPDFFELDRVKSLNFAFSWIGGSLKGYVAERRPKVNIGSKAQVTPLVSIQLQLLGRSLCPAFCPRSSSTGSPPALLLSSGHPFLTSISGLAPLGQERVLKTEINLLYSESGVPIDKIKVFENLGTLGCSPLEEYEDLLWTEGFGWVRLTHEIPEFIESRKFERTKAVEIKKIEKHPCRNYLMITDSAGFLRVFRFEETGNKKAKKTVIPERNGRINDNSESNNGNKNATSANFVFEIVGHQSWVEPYSANFLPVFSHPDSQNYIFVACKKGKRFRMKTQRTSILRNSIFEDNMGSEGGVEMEEGGGGLKDRPQEPEDEVEFLGFSPDPSFAPHFALQYEKVVIKKPPSHQNNKILDIFRCSEVLPPFSGVLSQSLVGFVSSRSIFFGVLEARSEPSLSPSFLLAPRAEKSKLFDLRDYENSLIFLRISEIVFEIPFSDFFIESQKRFPGFFKKENILVSFGSSVLIKNDLPFVAIACNSKSCFFEKDDKNCKNNRDSDEKSEIFVYNWRNDCSSDPLKIFEIPGRNFFSEISICQEFFLGISENALLLGSLDLLPRFEFTWRFPLFTYSPHLTSKARGSYFEESEKKDKVERKRLFPVFTRLYYCGWTVSLSSGEVLLLGKCFEKGEKFWVKIMERSEEGEKGEERTRKPGDIGRTIGVPLPAFARKDGPKVERKTWGSIQTPSVFCSVDLGSGQIFARLLPTEGGQEAPGSSLAPSVLSAAENSPRTISFSIRGLPVIFWKILEKSAPLPLAHPENVCRFLIDFEGDKNNENIFLEFIDFLKDSIDGSTLDLSEKEILKRLYQNYPEIFANPKEISRLLDYPGRYLFFRSIFESVKSEISQDSQDQKSGENSRKLLSSFSHIIPPDPLEDSKTFKKNSDVFFDFSFLGTRDIAFCSLCCKVKSFLVDHILKISKNKNELPNLPPGWMDLKKFGVGFWISSGREEQACLPEIMKICDFQVKRGVQMGDKGRRLLGQKEGGPELGTSTEWIEKIAIWAVLSKKQSLLRTLYLQHSRKNADNQAKNISEFLALDFRMETNAEKARKNAFVLLGKKRFEMAIAIYILGGDLMSACSVCLQHLQDPQLALVIASSAPSLPLPTFLGKTKEMEVNDTNKFLWRDRLPAWSQDPWWQIFCLWNAPKKMEKVEKQDFFESSAPENESIFEQFNRTTQLGAQPKVEEENETISDEERILNFLDVPWESEDKSEESGTELGFNFCPQRRGASRGLPQSDFLETIEEIENASSFFERKVKKMEKGTGITFSGKNLDEWEKFCECVKETVRIKRFFSEKSSKKSEFVNQNSGLLGNEFSFPNFSTLGGGVDERLEAATEIQEKKTKGNVSNSKGVQESKEGGGMARSLEVARYLLNSQLPTRSRDFIFERFVREKKEATALLGSLSPFSPGIFCQECKKEEQEELNLPENEKFSLQVFQPPRSVSFSLGPVDDEKDWVGGRSSRGFKLWKEGSKRGKKELSLNETEEFLPATFLISLKHACEFLRSD